ncbi:MAG TPA: hypothetical protein VJS92_13620, partial [Candidatus Polarisedimenticolaceae bacterium]|nr:hypothetical protein [Candidatus Polarisedimenticolaceae bacterium]
GAARFGANVVGWSLLGWASTGFTGVAGGAWMAARHGTQGAGFMVAMGTSMLARLLLAAAGAFTAATQGAQAAGAYAAGLAAGYLPLQVFEARWFLKRAAELR